MSEAAKTPSGLDGIRRRLVELERLGADGDWLAAASLSDGLAQALAGVLACRSIDPVDDADMLRRLRQRCQSAIGQVLAARGELEVELARHRQRYRAASAYTAGALAGDAERA